MSRYNRSIVEIMDELIALLTKKPDAPDYRELYHKDSFIFTAEETAYDRGWSDGWDACADEVRRILNKP